MPGMTWADLAPWMLSDLLLPLVIVAVAAYFCGCFNGAVIVSKYILRDDVRNHAAGTRASPTSTAPSAALSPCGHPVRCAQSGGGH